MLRDRRVLAVVVGVLSAALIWLAMYRLLAHAALYDELLHYLAAQGLLDSGVPRIAAGSYTRAEVFTRLVAFSLDHFGNTLTAARLPALAATMALASLLGAWLTVRVGWIAGVAAVVSLCVAPVSLDMAVFVRFYALHALVIFAVAVLAYEAGQAVRTRDRWLMALVAVALLPLAWHLQSTTAVAAVAMGVALIAVAVDRHAWLRTRLRQRWPWVLLLGLLTAGAGLLAGTKLHLLEQFTEVPLWAAWAANQPLFYLIDFAHGLPLLWPLWPLALLAAYRMDRALAVYCATALLIALLVHSLAAAKAARYVYYVMPFFCVVAGCGFEQLVRWSRLRIQRAWRGPSVTSALAVAGLATIVLGLSTEGQRLFKLLLGVAAPQDILSYGTEPDWSPVAADLRRAAAEADRLVVSNSMKAIYYLGRYDYELNASIVAETDTHIDFGLDERTGARAIASADALTRVIDTGGTTLLLLEDKKLNNPAGVSREALMVVTARCSTVRLAADVGLRAWICSARPAG